MAVSYEEIALDLAVACLSNEESVSGFSVCVSNKKQIGKMGANVAHLYLTILKELKGETTTTAPKTSVSRRSP